MIFVSLLSEYKNISQYFCEVDLSETAELVLWVWKSPVTPVKLFTLLEQQLLTSFIADFMHICQCHSAVV